MDHLKYLPALLLEQNHIFLPSYKKKKKKIKTCFGMVFRMVNDKNEHSFRIHK